jgi:hypothetical protein
MLRERLYALASGLKGLLHGVQGLLNHARDHFRNFIWHQIGNPHNVTLRWAVIENLDRCLMVN